MPALSTPACCLEDQLRQYVFKSCELFANCVVWFAAGHVFSGLQVFSVCLQVDSPSSLLLLGCNNTSLHLLS